MFNPKNEKINYGMRLAIVFLLFLFIDYVALIPIQLFNIKDYSGPTMVMLSTFKSLVLMVILFFIYRKELLNEWNRFKSNFMTNMDIGLQCWFTGLILMVVSNVIINNFFKATGAGNEEVVQQYISYMPWLMLINAGIIAPFTEELVFRKAFKDVISNKWLFVLVSGFVFGAMHVIGNVNAWYDVLYLFPYGALGSAFAYAYYETDTVFTSMSLHMIHNSILILASILTTMI